MNEKPNAFETLMGGTQLEVNFRNGTSDTVLVRQLAVKLFPELLQAAGDEPRLVELYCEKQPGWSDTLTNESFEAVILEGQRVNADFFGRWLARQRDRMRAIMPDLEERLIQANLSGPGLPSSLSRSEASPSKAP